MNDAKSHILYLLNRFEEKKASTDEVAALFRYFDDPSNCEIVQDVLESRMNNHTPSPEDIDFWKNRFAGKPLLQQDAHLTLPVRQISFVRLLVRYAAVILLVLGPVAYLLYTYNARNRSFTATKSVRPSETPDKSPGTNRATLTLSDGSQIVLDSSAKGILAQEAGTQVRKLADGQIAYLSGNAGTTTRPVYNTMTTPRGGQYELTLADGTKVWLNAASSISFPTSFTESERRVSITGEVYFEVAKNSHQPFRVKVNDKVGIHVLGTHFNVNAYMDERSINTTLIEGSLNVSAGSGVQRMMAGEQVQVTNKDIRLLKRVNTEQVVAWKNGAFSFDKDNLDAVLRQISRWYDVEIVYEKHTPERIFSGKMGRNLSLSQILKFLNEIDLHLKQEGNKIIVMK